jgi:hypothetical protein
MRTAEDADGSPGGGKPPQSTGGGAVEPELQPCQRSRSYRSQDCDRERCERPWCDSERRRRGALGPPTTPRAERRRRQSWTRYDRRRAEKLPAYAHGYAGVRWAYGRWRAQAIVCGRRMTLGIFAPTPAGERAAARCFRRWENSKG